MKLFASNINIFIKKRKKELLLFCQTFETKENGITLVLGRSGTGKTLLSLALSGTTSNNVYIKDGDKLTKINKGSSIFYAPTTSLLHDSLNLLENISFYSSNKDKIVESLINDFSFDNTFLHKSPKKMSQGERKIISFLIAIFSDKKIILLDEPFADIDKANKKICIKLLKKSNKTILIFDHEDINYLDLCARKYIIENKKLILKEDNHFASPLDKENVNEVSHTKHNNIFNLFKIALCKKRFYISSFIEGALAGITFLIFTLFINLTSINLSEDFSLMKDNLYLTYLITFLICLGLLLLFKIVFSTFYLKSYKTTLNLFILERVKKSRCLLFILISQIPFLISFLITYFSLFYLFLFKLPFLLNGTFYQASNYQSNLIAPTLLSLICLFVFTFLFIVLLTFIRFTLKKKNFALEEN